MQLTFIIIIILSLHCQILSAQTVSDFQNLPHAIIFSYNLKYFLHKFHLMTFNFSIVVMKVIGANLGLLIFIILIKGMFNVEN